jgi:hypothetical protein
MRRLDRTSSISFIDIASGAPCPLDRATLLGRFHAQEGNAAIVSGAAAFAAMWRAVPVLQPLGLLARNPWVLTLLERLYLHFLRIRPALIRRLLC